MQESSSNIVWLVLLVTLAGLIVAGILSDSAAFVGSLFAAFLSIVAILFYEAQMRPNIGLEIEDPVELGGRRFVRVSVSNKPMPKPFRIVLDRRPALLTRAWITFLTNDGKPVFRPGHRMRGRWSRTPEPARPVGLTQTGEVAWLLDPTITTDFIDIPPGAYEPLDVAMRVDDQTTCMGWHNGIIQNPNPTPDERFDLSSGRYLAQIEVETGGRRFARTVRIVNDVSYEHFRLDPL